MYAYNGKYLIIDLSTNEITECHFDEQYAKTYYGGYTMGAEILFRLMPANTDPFAPESVIGFVSGILNATGTFFGGRYFVVSKSPVSKGWNESCSGGKFGFFLKKAGVDAIFVKGVAKTPVYIEVTGGKAQIKDASHLWGKDILTTEDILKETLKTDKFSAATIGFGGENLSYMAAIINDGHRACGRGGPGAVMGSKNLKTIVVYGNADIEVADPDKIREINSGIAAAMRTGAGGTAHMSQYGTSSAAKGNILTNNGGVKNWAGESVEYYGDSPYFDRFNDYDAKHKIKKYACSACPLGCGALYDNPKEPDSDHHVARPEYETIAGFGSLLLIHDPAPVAEMNDLCNVYGLDSMSVSGTVAWVMECYEKGYLKKEQLDGLEMTWGNAEAAIKLTKKICASEGVGAILKNGSEYAANSFGVGHDALVVANGIEIPQHDSRLFPPLARTYKYDPCPGRHMKGGRGYAMDYDYTMTGFDDAAGLSDRETNHGAGYCHFSGAFTSLQKRIDTINAVSGLNYTEEEFFVLGLRSFMLRYMFNVREGLRRKDYYLSPRAYGNPPLESGVLKGITVDVERLAENFFDTIGCDREFVPKKMALKLYGGLDTQINYLYPGK